MTVLSQTTAAVRLALSSIPRRSYSTASTVLAIATVVMVLLGFLSMQRGYHSALEEAGARDVGMVLRQGATSAQASLLTPDQLGALSTAPRIARSASGQPLVSPELSVTVALKRRADAGTANLMVRGIAPESQFMLRNVRLVAGRAPVPGTNELIVGRSASTEFADLDVGGTVKMAGASWKIVGIFAAGGSVYESEARADLHIVQSLFRRGIAVQNARVAYAAGGTSELERFLKSRPELAMSAETERAYFVRLSEKSGNFIQRLGWPLALLMAVGALAGAGNAMYTSIDARRSEIVTLRSLGFGRLSVFSAVIAESTVLALAGSVIGIALSWLVFEGMQGSTIGSSLGQIVFQYRLSGGLIANALVLALMVGLVGAVAPAVRASRTPLNMAGKE